MKTQERWFVEVSIDQDDGHTYADADLAIENGAHLMGHGTARRNPVDPNVAEIGEEIAAARALSDLAHLLLGTAAAELEGVIHEPPRLRL